METTKVSDRDRSFLGLAGYYRRFIEGFFYNSYVVNPTYEEGSNF